MFKEICFCMLGVSHEERTTLRQNIFACNNLAIALHLRRYCSYKFCGFLTFCSRRINSQSESRCQDNSMLDSCALILWSVVRVPPQLNFHLELRGSPALCNSRRSKHKVTSHREKGPGHCSISRKLLSVQISTFDI